MSDGVLAAAIGTMGTIAGAIATIVVARVHASAKAQQSEKADDSPPTSPVLGHAVDIRELRILRALFGEPGGRFLEAYKDPYYRRSLDATVKKKLVAVVGGRYYLTAKGAEFCRAYLKELLGTWQPAVKIQA